MWHGSVLVCGELATARRGIVDRPRGRVCSAFADKAVLAQSRVSCRHGVPQGVGRVWGVVPRAVKDGMDHGRRVLTVGPKC